MAFVLIDGVIANATFNAPATAGTSSLIDGINNQQFATPATATAQPVDGLLGLSTWSATTGGATNYTLVCAVGSYAITGKNATFSLAKKLTAATGSYTVTGKPASLSLARKLTASAGSYALTGQAAALIYTAGASSIAYSLTCSAGSYNLLGQGVSFNYSAGISTDHPFYWYDSSPAPAPKIKRKPRLIKKAVNDAIEQAVNELIAKADKRERARLIAGIDRLKVAAMVERSKAQAKQVVMEQLKQQIQDEEDEDILFLLM